MSSSKIQSRNLDPSMDLAKESSVQSVLNAVKSNNGIFHMEYIEDVGLELQNLPVAIQRARTIIYNNEIHLLGGVDNPSIHYKYDGVKWMSVGTLPYKFQGGTAVVYNNEIHILGGNAQDSNTGILKYHYKYDGIKWTSVGTLPFEHYQVGENTIVYNNEIHVVGGYKSGTLKYHYKYNGSSWSSVSTLPIDAACPSVFYTIMRCILLLQLRITNGMVLHG